MNFKTWLSSGIFGILFAIAIRLEGIYKNIIKKK